MTKFKSVENCFGPFQSRMIPGSNFNRELQRWFKYLWIWNCCLLQRKTVSVDPKLSPLLSKNRSLAGVTDCRKYSTL